MLGQEKSSEYVLAELFGEADALDFGKGLFESEPTFGYLGERVRYEQGSTLSLAALLGTGTLARSRRDSKQGWGECRLKANTFFFLAASC